jgi:hypothetical protein
LNSIIEFIRALGGEDPQSTGILFHFSSAHKLSRCRTILKQKFPYIFYAADLIRQRFNINDQPIKIGKAWMVMKVTRDIEHCLNEGFFEA